MKRVVLLSIVLSCGLVSFLAPPAFAQSPPPVPPLPTSAPEEGEEDVPKRGAEDVQRPAQPRISVFEEVYRIPKKDAILLGDGLVRPHRVMNTVMRIVGEEGDMYLVKHLPPSDPRSPGHKGWILRQEMEAASIAIDEMLEGELLLPREPMAIPPFTDVIALEPYSEGLPTAGRWQNAFDVADIDGDGRLDIVTPPGRLEIPPLPHVFLQRAKGGWAPADVRWPDPEEVKLDYGAVRVADFDQDGNPDIAIACHFKPSFVLYGDGKGGFTRVVRLPRPAADVSSRSLAIADFNGDGRPDLATIAELDITMATAEPLRSGLVTVYLNEPGGWQAVSEGFPNEIMADDLTAADVDGDGAPDLVLTTRKMGIRELVFRNAGEGRVWESVGAEIAPIHSFVLASAAPVVAGERRIVLCVEQFDPKERGEPPAQACLLYDPAKLGSENPDPTILLNERAEFENVKRIAVGDLDGDGRDDLAIITNRGTVRLLLQRDGGELWEERSPELADLDGDALFDVVLADLDGDGRDDLVVSGSPGNDGDGGIWAFLSRKKAWDAS